MAGKPISAFFNNVTDPVQRFHVVDWGWTTKQTDLLGTEVCDVGRRVSFDAFNMALSSPQM